MINILQEMAVDVRANQQRIRDAEQILSVLRDVGEDTRAQEQLIKELKAKQAKWVEALRSRGVNIE